MPGANPAEAAALARAAADEGGISPMSGDPSPSPRAPAAAMASPATHPAITSSATGLEVANRASRELGLGGLPGETLRNIRPPNAPISAGISVSDTTMATSTVAASPGPKARSKPPRATRSVAVPAATISPAVKTIGDDAAVASRAACRRSAPSASRVRISGQEEHAVIRGHAEKQHDQDRLRLLRKRGPGALRHPLHQPDGDDVRRSGTGQRGERRKQRPEPDPHDQRDRQHGEQLHPAEVAIDDQPLLVLRRHRPGHPDDIGEVAMSVRLGVGDLLFHGGVRAELQVGDDR